MKVIMIPFELEYQSFFSITELYSVSKYYIIVATILAQPKVPH